MIGSWFGVVGFKSINCEDLLVYQVLKLNDIKKYDMLGMDFLERVLNLRIDKLPIMIKVQVKA